MHVCRHSVSHYNNALLIPTLALPPIKTTAELTALGKWIKDVSLDTMLATAHPLLVSMFKEAESNTSPFRDSLIRARSIVKAASEGQLINCYT